MEKTEGSLLVDGVRIAYEISGQGEPIVMIAGLGYDRYCWSRLVPSLSQHFQVITFDNRGVGLSSVPIGPYSAKLMAKDTLGLIEHLGFKKVNVVGISMGGFIAQSLVQTNSSVVNKLVLMCTSLGGTEYVPAQPEVIQKMVEKTSDVRANIEMAVSRTFLNKQPKFIREWIEYRRNHGISVQGYQSQLAVGLAMMKPENSFKKCMQDFTKDTLIIFGEDDQIVPVENGVLLKKYIPRSKLIRYEHVGHFIPMENPEKLTEDLQDFFVNGIS